eukprot:2234850-Rhodomonas_salina.3
MTQHDGARGRGQTGRSRSENAELEEVTRDEAVVDELEEAHDVEHLLPWRRGALVRELSATPP